MVCRHGPGVKAMVRKRTLRLLHNILSRLQGGVWLSGESVIKNYLTYPSSQPDFLMLETVFAPTA